MRVSVITSCYNRVRTIRSGMESVLIQDYSDIEYIIVDGASSDGSLDVIREIESFVESSDFRSTHPRFMLKVISERDHNMYEAINKGIRMATGDVIGLVHSDDFLYDTHVISDIAETFGRTGADLVYGNGLFVDSERTDKVVRNWISGHYSRGKVRYGWLPLHPTVYIKREAMERWGLYDESYRIAADSDLLVRYLYEAVLKVVYMDRYIVRMRMGGLSTDPEKMKRKWTEDIRMYRSHGFNPYVSLCCKVLSKVPQFVSAKLGVTLG